MRQPKEERIIEHGSEILKELHKVYLEGIGIDEYYKLLQEYKKLYRRYEKTIKLSDNMGNEIMEQNDSLNDNLQYTIKTARNKLLENVKEHRKTKDAYTQYKELIKKYEVALDESYKENAKLEKKLNTYIKHFGEINHKFSEDLSTNKDQVSSAGVIDINPAEYKNMDIKKVLSLELSKHKNNLILAKISLKDFGKMRDVIEQNSSINNFIKGTLKYLKNVFDKDDIIFHDGLEVFYILILENDAKKAKTTLEKLNINRKIFNFTIKFAIGATKFVDGKDNKDTFLRRCESAFKESEENNKIVVK